MDSMDELRSPSRPTSPAASIIVFPLPSTLFVLQLLGTIRCPEKPRAAQMQPISYARHQFPAEIIRYAVWLYLRFTLSYRDVKELLAERGLELSYETVRPWVAKFGPLFARNLRKLRPKPSGTWHLDEMAVRIGGKRMW